MTVEERLKAIIVAVLGGPRGDPDPHHCLAAAHAILALQEIGYGTPDEDRTDILRNLGSGNIHDIDFMAVAARDGAI